MDNRSKRSISTISSVKNKERYLSLKTKNSVIDNDYPSAYIPSPTQENYNKGWISRYFIQRRDTKDSPIIEVSEEGYSKVSLNVYFIGVRINWRISGELEDKYTESGATVPSVITSNQTAINAASQTMPDIRMYLVNLKQFWKPTI
jgi:hypothetical protein